MNVSNNAFSSSDTTSTLGSENIGGEGSISLGSTFGFGSISLGISFCCNGSISLGSTFDSALGSISLGSTFDSALGSTFGSTFGSVLIIF